MRPINLTIKAFGPYANTQFLNFEENLVDSNLFLIHGATGAGKTSILDAILFALYGTKNFGNGRDGKMMRSKHADSDTPTEVELEFALGNKTYKVKRTISPDLQKINAELKDLDKGIIQTKNVTEEVERIIGFGSEQFRQVILLQQGQFKKFLLAKTSERQKILETLFDARFYKEVEDKLAKEAKKLNEELNEISDKYDSKLKDEGVTNEEELKSLITSTEEELKISNNIMKELDIKRKSAQDELVKGGSIHQKFQELEERAKNLNESEKALRQTELDLKIATTEYDNQKALEEDRKQLDKKIDKLEKIRIDLAELEKIQTSHARSEAESKEIEAEVEILKGKEIKFEERLEQRRNEREQYLKSAENLKFYQSKVDECQKRDTLLKNMTESRKKAEINKNNVSKLEELQNNIQLKLDRLKQLAKLGRAALLAQDLKEGEPCLVCGSTVHPKLAISEDIIPTDEEIEKVEIELNRRAKEKSSAEANLAKYLAVLQNQENDLAQMGDIGNFEEWNQKLQAAKKAEKELVLCEKRLKEGQDLTDKLKSELKDKQNSYTKAIQTTASLAGSIKEKECQIPQQYRLDDGNKKLEDELNVLQSKSKSMKDSWEKAEKNYIFLDKQFAAIKSKFENLSEIHANLANQLKDVSKPNLESLQQKFNESETNYTAQTKNVVELKAKSERLEKVQKIIIELNNKIQECKNNCTIWNKLSKVANGDNAQKMKFQTYILNAVFQDIIYEANTRLEMMSGKRYHFEYKVPTGGGVAFHGLDLEIYDEFTSTKRPIETLSGGESFLASLSLALGLADVVQNNAGGIKLDTIFIDEGFGSLDSETLDQTIQSLNELQKDGRLVGIISHVEELKQQIQTKLEVFKGKNGSYAKFINY